MQLAKTRAVGASNLGHQLRLVWGVLICCVLSGCAGGLSHSLEQSLSIIAPKQIDFAELEHYAQRSSDAYKPVSDIRAAYPQATRISTVQPVDVRYFVEQDANTRTQTISIRGTAEKPNIWEDIETALIPDSILGISLHRGFRKDAQAVLRDAKPHLRKDYGIRITGHSLGGAVAAILGLYLEKDGYRIDRVVTFGEPRFTTQDLMTNSLTNTTRVVHDRDVVPLLPPHSVFGKYKHSSEEVILRPGNNYVYMEQHDADRLSVGEFWRNATSFSFSDHHMDGYQSNIQLKKAQGARQVPYLFNSRRKVTFKN